MKKNDFVLEFFYVSNISAKEEKKEEKPRFFEEKKQFFRESGVKQAQKERQKKANNGVMLSRPYRLSKKDGIARVIKSRGAKNPYLTLKFLKNGLGRCRFGFVVSSKLVKKAVYRNLIKRRAREIIKKNIGRIKTGYDIVFIFSGGLEGVGYEILERELLSLLTESDLI